MSESPSSAQIFCNSCNRATDHSVQGTYTHPSGSPDIDPYPSFEAEVIRQSVESYFETKLKWPMPEQGWEWLTNPDDWAPDDDVDDVVHGLDEWLNSSPRLQQELYPQEEMMTWKLFEQGWKWLDILLGCERGIAKQERWEILKCKGCHKPSLRLMRWSEEDDVRHPETGQLLKRMEHPEYYPPRANDSRPPWLPPSWIHQTPEAVRRLLNESYMALNQGLLSVGSMGIRSVIEVTMVEFVGDKGGFEPKLKRLLDQGIITEKEKDALSAVIDFGHAAVHRQQDPTAQNVQILIELVETLLRRLFVMPHQASELRRNTRPRY